MVWQLLCCIETTKKKPLELSLLRVLCLESFLELYSYSFTSPQNPVVIDHELSAQFIVRYSGWDVKGLWLKFVIVLLYRNFYCLARGFKKIFYINQPIGLLSIACNGFLKPSKTSQRLSEIANFVTKPISLP